VAREDIYYYCATDPVYDPEWHWITDQIALGSYPLEPAMEELLKQGVRAILSVRMEEPDYVTSRFEDAAALLVEDWFPFPYDLLVEGIRFIDRNVRAGRRVYVHCFAGVSRSSFLVSCYLMLVRGIPFEEALATVRDRRPIVSPHPGLFDDELLERLVAERETILNPVAEAV
jgi:predicted protein tyrosine phosphatase